jgi:inosose dehydratase
MTAPTFELATGPVTWGVDFADAPGNPPWALVLDEIRDSGLGALELGPVGFLPEEPGVLADELAARSLRGIGSFAFDHFHDPSRGEALGEATGRACRFIAAAGGGFLVIIDRPAGTRVQTAGRSDAARRLPQEEWRGLTDAIETAAETARAAGLRPVFHPHAGSCVEFEDEIDRLLEDVEIELCLDLGHAAYAGIGAAEGIDRWGARLAHLHLKDVDPDVLAEVRARRLDFWEAIAAGVFCPLGDGVVDFGSAAAGLAAVGYEGFATIEQDRVPGSGEPLSDLRRSLTAMEAAGMREAEGDRRGQVMTASRASADPMGSDRPG